MLDYAGLQAVATVLSEGSFERAAERLGVTPSAVSQRVRQIEDRLGAALIVRGQPCTPTPAGLKIRAHVDRVAELETELAGGWPDRQDALSARPVTLRIAVNADSLAAWLMPALADFCHRTGHLVDVALDDQDHTAEWLRSGAVVAAVTAEPAAIPGCRVHPLGALRYRATASPSYMARHCPDGPVPVAVSAAPVLVYNRKDRLQHRFLETHLPEARLGPCHWLPSPEAFVAASLAGMGWGMNPALMVDPLIAAGRLVDLVPGAVFDVGLYWQVQRRSGPVTETCGRAVMAMARERLVRPAGEGSP